ncbi:beta-RFAP synthase [bacterium]|nr:beta-RFAP synthase [bacterium]
MKRLIVRAPGRLHFGLLGWGPNATRQFGGFGLMIESPNFIVSAEPADRDVIEASEERIDRLGSQLNSIRKRLRTLGGELPPCHFRFESDLPPHHGLGSGTQTSLAMAEISLILSGCQKPSKEETIAAAGRYPRSGVGTHGYFSGGLIVDEGHPPGIPVPSEPARLLRRCAWPHAWHIVTVFPQESEGPSGSRESAAFEELPPPSADAIRHVSSLIRDSFLPAIDTSEPDFESAMSALESTQEIVGSWFAPAQGGHVYGSEQRDRRVAQLRELGLRGLGQSSWGPTLFGFSCESESEIRSRLETAFGPSSIKGFNCGWLISKAANQGRHLSADPPQLNRSKPF